MTPDMTASEAKIGSQLHYTIVFAQALGKVTRNSWRTVQLTRDITTTLG